MSEDQTIDDSSEQDEIPDAFLAPGVLSRAHSAPQLVPLTMNELAKSQEDNYDEADLVAGLTPLQLVSSAPMLGSTSFMGNSTSMHRAIALQLAALDEEYKERQATSPSTSRHASCSSLATHADCPEPSSPAEDYDQLASGTSASNCLALSAALAA